MFLVSNEKYGTLSIYTLATPLLSFIQSDTSHEDFEAAVDKP